MNRINVLLLILTFFSFSNIHAQYTDVINSNRPGKSMSAFSVGKTVIQAELGVYGVNEKHEFLEYQAKGMGTDLSLRYGAFLEQLEFNIDLQYQNDKYESFYDNYNRKGFKNSIIGVKYLIYDPNKNYEAKVDIYSWDNNHKFKFRSLIPAVGIYAGMNLNLTNNEFSFASDPKLSPKAMLITQNQLGRSVFVTNIIADKIGTEFPSYGYIVTLTRGFNPEWIGFIETQGYISNYYADNVLRGGAAYLIHENIQIDLNIGVNFKNTPSILVGGFGISWRFDENYTEILLRAPQEKSKKDKKGKDNSKDKSKKRLDEVPAPK
ncbi:MAG: transporter [Flavobacteriaceae bacterium]|jgi:hypothetical protein|nr:transporter [Flavobacteriaceae bacterium]